MADHEVIARLLWPDLWSGEPDMTFARLSLQLKAAVEFFLRLEAAYQSSAAGADPLPATPRKRGSKTAAETYFCQILSNYFDAHRRANRRYLRSHKNSDNGCGLFPRLPCNFAAVPKAVIVAEQPAISRISAGTKRPKRFDRRVALEIATGLLASAPRRKHADVQQ